MKKIRRRLPPADLFVDVQGTWLLAVVVASSPQRASEHSKESKESQGTQA